MRPVPRQRQVDEETLPGRVLICGTGFLVLAGMWAILGFFRYEGGMNSAAIIDLVLTFVHIIVGVLIYRRTPAIWYVGLALCGVAMAATLPNHYYFPLAANGILGVLLYLSRNDFPDVANVSRSASDSA
jgi:hypothetical protein